MARHPVATSGVILWLLAAWPTWIVDLPPLQDLPNHMASAWVQLHPDHFPDLVSNGFFKTNSAFFLFMHLLGRLFGVRVAAKLFVTLTLGVGAFVYPLAVERLASKKVWSATLVLWPFVHNWFVAMGMLDFALGIPLALATLVALDAHRKAPTIARGVLVAILAALVWYTHAFVFMELCLLVALEALATGERFDVRAKVRAMIVMTIPLLPAVALTFVSVLEQLATETSETALTEWRGFPAILYGLWAEWLWSMTKWTLVTIVPCAVVAYYGLRKIFRERPAFFTPLATVALALACLSAPHLAYRWFFLGSRFFPFFWIALLLRMPEELPKWLARALAACAVVYSIGLGVEYRWVRGDWDRVLAAEPSVPERSRLFTMMFDMKGRRGDNTRPFTHVSALFVVDRDAFVPSLFAHSRSFPITYRTFPPKQLGQLSLEMASEELATRAHFCEKRAILLGDCDAEYDEEWRAFWREVAPRFDHALLLDPTPDVRARIPASFHADFDRDGVVVLTTAAVP